MPYYRSYRKRYSPYRSWRRSGFSRSQTQGTRRFSVSIPVEGYASVPVPADSRNSYSILFQPWYTSNSPSGSYPDYYMKYGNVVNNGVYQIYTRLYDEVKIEGVSLQVAVQGLPPSVNGFKCVSAVDRHFSYTDIGTIQRVALLMGAPESMSKTFTSLQNAKIYRSFWARDISERSMFADATLGVRDIAATQTLAAYQQAGLEEFLNNGTYAVFCPGITVGFELSAAPNADSNISIQFKIVWRFTFRNPKYGGGTLSRSFEKFSETRAEEIEDLKRRSQSDEGREVEVLKDDDTLIDAKSEMEESESEPTREELLEMLAKYQKTA